MNWMQFIIALLNELAWPAVVIFALVIGKAPLSRLIVHLRQLKYKDLEFEFGQDIKQVTKKAEHAFPELKFDHKALLIASANNLPNSAVLEAWDVVDTAAEKLVTTKVRNIDLNSKTKYKLIETLLISEQIIDIKKAKLFSELRQLRNKVAHAAAYKVGKVEVIQYIELCFKLAAHLNELQSDTEDSQKAAIGPVATIK